MPGRLTDPIGTWRRYPAVGYGVNTDNGPYFPQLNRHSRMYMASGGVVILEVPLRGAWKNLHCVGRNTPVGVAILYSGIVGWVHYRSEGEHYIHVITADGRRVTIEYGQFCYISNWRLPDA